MSGTQTSVPDQPSEFTPDCSACAALCCVSLFLERGDRFNIDKPAGAPCPNLTPGGHLCTIHGDLERRGFSGCVRFDCRGAGQRTIQEVFDGQSWRDHPELLDGMSETFRLMRQVQEAREILHLMTRLPLTDEQANLRDTLAARFETPPDGWTQARLSALERTGAFRVYKNNLKAFQTALAAPQDAT